MFSEISKPLKTKRHGQEHMWK